MLNISVLTCGFTTANGIAFLAPLIYNQKRLKNFAIKINFFTQAKKGLFNCDILGIDSKFFRANFQEALFFLEKARQKVKAVIWFDTTDSSACGQFEVLPYVNSYRKFQILKDKTLYLRPFYGNRIWTDYYHNEFKIDDESIDRPRFVNNKEDLNKIDISWSPGLADYSLDATKKNNLLKFLPLFLKMQLLSYPKRFIPVRRNRPLNISCRISLYDSYLVSFQRIRIREIFKKMNVDTNRISRTKYFKEMQNAKVVVAPFGWGEMTYRDFEAFLSGAILLKPDMGHLDTWPDFYQRDQTAAFFNWDLSDLEEKLDKIITEYNSYSYLAIKAQDIYKRYTSTEEGHNEFCQRFKQIIENAS